MTGHWHKFEQGNTNGGEFPSETVTDVFYTKMGIQETKFMFT